MVEIADNNNVWVTIAFDTGAKTFTYSCDGGGLGNQNGRKLKVKKEKGLKWKSNVPWGVRFDPSFRPDEPSPLPLEWYCGPGDSAPVGGNVKGDTKGRYKYWVAVYSSDGNIYMDDPDVVVEA